MREERLGTMQDSYRGGRATASLDPRPGGRLRRSPTRPGRPAASVRGTAARPVRLTEGSRRTGPATAATSAARPSPRPDGQRAGRGAAAPRAPFILLVLGLLGGGLVSLLVINTTLGATSFKITQLQQSDSTMAQQEQSLQRQVSAEEAPAQIWNRAYQLGMRPVGHVRFLDVGSLARAPSAATRHRSERSASSSGQHSSPRHARHPGSHQAGLHQ